MSRFAFTLVLGCAALALACREQPAAAPAPKPTSSAPTSGPVFRLHFAGLQHVATNASSAKLNALLNTPEAVATRKQVHDRLAVTLPSTLFGPSANTNAGALLRPLLDEIPSLFDEGTAVVTMQNGIPFWYFQRHGGEFEGRTVESVDPGGLLVRAIPAERIALQLVQTDTAQVKHLAETILTARERIRFCEICGSLTEKSPCSTCTDDRRDLPHHGHRI